jgi:hypothetical protein
MLRATRVTFRKREGDVAVTASRDGTSFTLFGLSKWAVADIVYTLFEVRKQLGMANKIDVFMKESDWLRIMRAGGGKVSDEAMADAVYGEATRREKARKRTFSVRLPLLGPKTVLAHVKSSQSAATYTVTREKLPWAGCEVAYFCTCPGFHFHNGTCKHVDALWDRPSSVEPSNVHWTPNGRCWAAGGRL